MKNKIVKYILSFLITIAIFVALFYFADISKVKEVLSSIPAQAYIIIILIYSVAWLMRGWRWKTLLKFNNYSINILKTTCMSVFGNFANLFVPARLGDIAWIYGTKKSFKVSTSVSFVTIVFNRFLDFLGLLIIIQFSAFIITKQFLQGWVQTINILSAVVALLFIVLLFLFTNQKLMKRVFIGPLKRFKKYYSMIRKSIIDTVRKKGMFILLIIISLFVWIFESMVAYILLISLSVEINFFFVVFAIVIANLTKIIGITPGGTGTYEATMALILVGLGNVGYELALTISILDHLIKKIFVFIVGGLTLSHFGLKVFYNKNKNKGKKPKKKLNKRKKR